MTLNLRGRLFDLDTPKVMAIINATPDSFYAGSRSEHADTLRRNVAKAVAEGADILDVGAFSTRSGAAEISAREEMDRLRPALQTVRELAPALPLSVDTFRADVAEMCIAEFGADIVNDISGGSLDPEIWDVVAAHKVPYVLTHSRGNPQTMQTLTDYDDVTADVVRELAFKAAELRLKGVCDVILDPGFGFAKTLDQNYRLLAELQEFKALGMPLLVGMSRKSMVYRVLGCQPEDALEGTLSLDMAALMKGADILRVHDVKAARDQVKIFLRLREASQPLLFDSL